MNENNETQGEVLIVYTKEQLISFGNYLLSREREDAILDNPEGELDCVGDWDFEEWKNMYLESISDQ